MPTDDASSLNDEQTFEGGAQPANSSDRSLGDQSTFGGGGTPPTVARLNDAGTFGNGGTVTPGRWTVTMPRRCDPALQLLVDIWSELPDAVRDQIMWLAGEAIAVRR